MKYFIDADEEPNIAPLTREEQETSFLYSEASGTCYCYTCSPILLRKLDEFVVKRPDIYHCVKRKKDCGFYEFPKKYLTPKLPKEISDSQKKCLRDRALKAREQINRRKINE